VLLDTFRRMTEPAWIDQCVVVVGSEIVVIPDLGDLGVRLATNYGSFGGSLIIVVHGDYLVQVDHFFLFAEPTLSAEFVVGAARTAVAPLDGVVPAG